jgi:enoyl-CoA hydratase/carnithine racemase
VEHAEEIADWIKGQIKSGRLLHRFDKVLVGLRKLDKPSIAMVNGAAVGAGFDIALACDMRIGSENARFMVAFTRLGLIPDATSWFLPRAVGAAKAAELLFSGDFLGAQEAEKVGVLNKVVPASELEKETMALARRIAQGPPIAHRLNKLLLYQGLDMGMEAALAFNAAAIYLTVTSEDHLEGVKAFVEKRAPVFRGK